MKAEQICQCYDFTPHAEQTQTRDAWIEWLSAVDFEAFVRNPGE